MAPTLAISAPRVVLWAAVLAALGAGLASAASSVEVLPFAWTSVPTSPSAATAIPYGCTCIDTDQNPCTRIECTCTCNIRAGECDPNCCCDPECPAAVVARARADGTCLPEGVQGLTYSRCVESTTTSSALATVNTKPGMAISTSLDGLLCVAADNSPVAGTFLSDPGFPGASVFLRDDIVAAPSFGSASTTAGTAVAATGSAEATYVAQTTPVLAARVTSATGATLTLDVSGRGLLRVPSAASGGGQCALGTPVVYAADVAASTCADSAPRTAAECAALSPQALLSQIRIATTPTSASSTPGTGWLEVAVANDVTVVDLAAGGATSNTSWAAISALSSTDASRFSASGCACRYVLRSADITFTHNQEGTISAVAASISVYNTTTSCADSLARSFSVAWALDATTAATLGASLANNNLVARTRSGNPGYLSGSAVLGGVSVTDGTKTAISAYRDGLYVMGAGAGGACSTTDPSIVPVQMGEDLVLGCQLALTPASLQAMCGTTVPAFLGTNATHVGIFGNADPVDVGQWLAITRQAPNPSGSYDAATASCTNMLTGYKLELLVARVGEERNAQKKIIAAKASYVTSTLVADSGASSTAVFTTEVSFVELADGALDRFIPPPPMVIQLPHDLFYPFIYDNTPGTLTSGAPPALGGSAIALVAAGAALALLAQRRRV